jgi:hypothetical protein
MNEKVRKWDGHKRRGNARPSDHQNPLPTWSCLPAQFPLGIFCTATQEGTFMTAPGDSPLEGVTKNRQKSKCIQPNQSVSKCIKPNKGSGVSLPRFCGHGAEGIQKITKRTHFSFQIPHCKSATYIDLWLFKSKKRTHFAAPARPQQPCPPHNIEG